MMMDFRVKIALLSKVYFLAVSFMKDVSCDESRNLQNHRNGILNMKDITDHWIGFPKSPYANSFTHTVTPHPTTSSTIPPTSSPRNANKYSRRKKTKSKKPSSKRRYEEYDRPAYKDGYPDKDYEDFEYDYNDFGPIVQNPYGPKQYVVQASAATPKAIYANSADNSKTFKAIYAGIPKVATYVIPNTKKYVVQRVKSEAVYVPPVSSGSDPFTAVSRSGMRRVDPLDYDDTGGGGGGGGNSFLNLGPQEGFPPRPVMNKITQAGQRQPCHGPECHQHHKGLVRFYWRRVVYPQDQRGGGIGRNRFRRPSRNGRRRLRGSARAPSDQRDVYYNDEKKDETDDDDDNSPQEDVNNEDVDEDEEEEEEEEDNQEEDTNRRNAWKSKKGYGHDLTEGSNYNDREIKTYRDKRFAYRKRMRRRYPKHLDVYNNT